MGSGKTLTSLVYYYTKACKGLLSDSESMRDPMDLYVITTARKRDSLDWQRDAAKLGISGDRESSVGNVQMTVDSWNNIAKYQDVKDAFFIFDEQRLVGSGAWTKSFLKLAKSNKWILLSGTPGDTWLDYIPVFLANGFYKNRTEFKREHVVYNTYAKFPKVDRYIGVGKLLRNRNKILVHMPYERHTTRHTKVVQVDHDKELFEKVVDKRWHVYEERPLRDVAELFGVMRKVVNSDTSRIRALRQVLDSHPKVIVFYNFDYELEVLRALGSDSTKHSTTLPVSEESVPEYIEKSKTPPWETCSLNCPKCQTTHDGQTLLTQQTNLRDSSESSSSLGSGTGFSMSHEASDLCGQEGGTVGSRRSDEECLDGLSDSKKRDSLSPTDPCGSCEPQPENKFGLAMKESASTFSIAEWNGHKHEEIPQTDSWVYLVQYVAGAEAWNCIDTDAIVFYSLTYSYKNFEQAKGRIDRMNTPFKDLYYYLFVSDSLIDKAIVRSLKSKKSFNEKDLRV